MKRGKWRSSKSLYLDGKSLRQSGISSSATRWSSWARVCFAFASCLSSWGEHDPVASEFNSFSKYSPTFAARRRDLVTNTCLGLITCSLYNWYVLSTRNILKSIVVVFLKATIEQKKLTITGRPTQFRFDRGHSKKRDILRWPFRVGCFRARLAVGSPRRP